MYLFKNKRGEEGDTFLAVNVIKIVLAIFGILILIYLVYRLFWTGWDLRAQQAQETLDYVVAKLNYLDQHPELNSIKLEINKPKDWYLYYWGGPVEHECSAWVAEGVLEKNGNVASQICICEKEMCQKDGKKFCKEIKYPFLSEGNNQARHDSSFSFSSDKKEYDWSNYFYELPEICSLVRNSFIGGATTCFCKSNNFFYESGPKNDNDRGIIMVPGGGENYFYKKTDEGSWIKVPNGEETGTREELEIGCFGEVNYKISTDSSVSKFIIKKINVILSKKDRSGTWSQLIFVTTVNGDEACRSITSHDIGVGVAYPPSKI
jgi:hypothetical protein